MISHQTLNDSPSLEILLQWLTEYRRNNGRPLRVLHYGNIANNGYLNAKFLRAIGVDAHVICPKFSHIMGTPEWEELEITHPYGDDYYPDFDARDVGTYLRPDWFFDGSLEECLQQITSMNLRGLLLPPDRQDSADIPFPPQQVLRLKMTARHLDGLTSRLDVTISERMSGIANQATALAARLDQIQGRVDQIQARVGQSFIARWFHRGVPVARRIRWFRRIYRWIKYGEPLIFTRQTNVHNQSSDGDSEAGGSNRPISLVANFPRSEKDRDISRAIKDFAALFPTRRDRLSRDDVAEFADSAPMYREIFAHYDLIQCYSTDPLWGYLAGNRPYVGFEHGTLRTFTMEDNSISRLTALAYRKAAHSFITNGDCLAYARALGLTDFSAMIHPVDVELHRRDMGEPAAAVKRRFGADILLFCPIRHDWEVKGIDVHLHALPLIRASVPGRVVLALIRWGLEVDKSRALIAQTECADLIVWLPPLSRISMIRMIRAADIVLDQMALPHFGATAPQALAAGTPVISSYKPESTTWIVDEPAPILPAFSATEVRDAVLKALDPAWRAEYSRRARYWVDKYHHPNRLVTEHLRVYRQILARSHEVRR
jgi:glycosyltransferase involved in cell wall biosynthesis